MALGDKCNNCKVTLTKENYKHEHEFNTGLGKISLCDKCSYLPRPADPTMTAISLNK